MDLKEHAVNIDSPEVAEISKKIETHPRANQGIIKMINSQEVLKEKKQSILWKFKFVIELNVVEEVSPPCVQETISIYLRVVDVEDHHLSISLIDSLMKDMIIDDLH